MARQLKADAGGEENTGIANTSARREAQNKGFAAMYDIEQRIAEKMDEHIKPLRKDLTKKRREIKKDCDIDGEDLKINYAMYKRTQQALAMADDADRDRILGNLHDSFAALVTGGQLDWIDAALQDAGYTRTGGANDDAAAPAEAAE